MSNYTLIKLNYRIMINGVFKKIGLKIKLKFAQSFCTYANFWPVVYMKLLHKIILFKIITNENN